MAKVKVELDLEVIQEALEAEVAPAVSAILSQHYDIKALISEALLKEPDKDDCRGMHGFLPMYFPYGYGPTLTGRALIERLIHNAIVEAAKEYVNSAIAERREAIQASFRAMMKDSPDRLANAFVDMIEGADIDLKLSAKLSVDEDDDEDED